jgi:hypothetical protein
MSFDRVYAQIPADRDDVFTGTTAYTFPGIATNLANGTERTISGYSTSSGETTLTATNTASVGDVVYVAITGSTGTIENSFVALTGTSGSQVVISAIDVGTFDSGTLTELAEQPRGQKTIPTGSVTDFSYYLPGVTAGITTFDDVTETEVFAPFSAFTGRAVSTLSAGSVPTAEDYAADGNYLTIESNITRWMGNIIQKADVKVRAL